PLYTDDAGLVIRCGSLNKLETGWRPRIEKLGSLLPELNLPELPPGTLLRVRFGLPDSVTVDRLRPFAFLRTAAGWVALIPVNGKLDESDLYRRVDEHYCVAGRPDAVEKYVPGMRKGYFLPGEVSVLARRDGVATLPDEMDAATELLGMTLPAWPRLDEKLVGQIGRVDLALAFEQRGLRVDARLAPDPAQEGSFATLLEGLAPHAGKSAQVLGTRASVELGCRGDAVSLIEMTRVLTEAGERPIWPEVARDAIAMFGDDATVQLQMQDGQAGALVAVAKLTEADREAAETCLRSKPMRDGLERLGLACTDDAFRRNGFDVCMISGLLPAAMRTRLKESGSLGAALDARLGERVVGYATLADGYLCVTVGPGARGEMETMLDAVATGKPRRDEAAAKGDPLVPDRSFTVRVDLDALLRAMVAIEARYKGVLVEEPMQLRVDGGVRGGALHLAARLPDELGATMFRRLRARLDTQD
ncbi:MAG: hypothetical protein AAGD14_18770, partial [Planctomycetota bacterium]